MLIGQIVAKLLVIVESFLDFFVTLTATTGAVGLYNCATLNLNTYSGTLTPCGTSVIISLEGLMTVGIAALNSLLGGLLST